MVTTISATYQGGVLRLNEPLALADGTQVDVIILVRDVASPGGSPAEILAAIAALPVERESDGFSGRDHDRLLYDGQGAP